MKILHTSDLHLASPLTARLTGEKLRTRRGELSLVLERTAEEAIYRGASVMIIAGDLFDTERISNKDRERIFNTVNKYPTLDFLYLPGNHERRTLFLGRDALPTNLKVFDEGWTYFDYGILRIAGRSELSRDMFDSYTADPCKKNIVVLHGSVSERSSDEAIGLRDAEGRGIDYLALGHYHSYGHYSLGDGGVAVYSGAPEGRGFDEAGAHGAVLIETDGESVTHSFIKTARREVVIKNVDITTADTRLDIDRHVEGALSEISRESLVRVVLTGRHSPKISADTDTLFRRYADNFFYFEIKDESGIVIDPEEYRYDRSLKGEFIRLVTSADMDEKLRERIIKAGLMALAGDVSEV